jgi:hypothetical protein
MDMFATRANTQLSQFVSPLWSDKMLIQDALAISWKGRMPYLHPPIPLIGRCLRKVLNEEVGALMVLPDWRGQSWSVLLNKMSQQSLCLGRSENILIPGHQMIEKGDKLPPGRLIAHLLLPPFVI